jgi:uncharacterized membrane protein YeaQ/YmgE (transglycosylase-associated protein family)
MILNILVWALFGLLAGVVAKFVTQRPQAQRNDPMGILWTILLGIAGAVIGGFVVSSLFNWDINTFSIAGFAVAVGGALILLFLYGLLMTTRRSV